MNIHVDRQLAACRNNFACKLCTTFIFTSYSACIVNATWSLVFHHYYIIHMILSNKLVSINTCLNKNLGHQLVLQLFSENTSTSPLLHSPLHFFGICLTSFDLRLIFVASNSIQLDHIQSLLLKPILLTFSLQQK